MYKNEKKKKQKKRENKRKIYNIKSECTGHNFT